MNRLHERAVDKVKLDHIKHEVRKVGDVHETHPELRVRNTIHTQIGLDIGLDFVVCVVIVICV